MPSRLCASHDMKKSRNMPQPGDVFVRRHPDGRYGALRVLRRQASSLLVSTSEYLADRPPLETDPQLRIPIEQYRFSFGGQRAIRWTRGVPPASHQFAFNLPLTHDETSIECSTYGLDWSEDDGFEVFMEWQWKHDRAALEEEMERERELRDAAHAEALRAQRPKRMMSEKTFWALIALLDWSQSGNDAAVVAPVVSALAKLTSQSIRQFEERLATLLYQLDTQEHAKHIGEQSYVDAESSFSADGFLYARCAAVANGRAFYATALASPSCMPKDVDFEALLGIASSAFEAKTGESLGYQTGCSYESFSNLAGWRLESQRPSA